jgi:hypothetical protein
LVFLSQPLLVGLKDVFFASSNPGSILVCLQWVLLKLEIPDCTQNKLLCVFLGRETFGVSTPEIDFAKKVLCKLSV